MANSINTNIGALTAQKNMVQLNKDLDDAMNRLSSGLRINSAADDAAGSAIASKMDAQVKSLGVAIRNSYDAISMTQTAEGALGEVENMLQRVRELSVQAGNSTLSDSDRSMIQSEVDALIAEIDSISANTHFNNVKLLDGSSADVKFQIGINASDSLSVNLQKSDSISLGLSGATGVTTLTSERVDELDFSNTASTIAAADVKINGFNAFASDFNSDTSASSANEALLLATAINANTGVHGAEADAFNSVQSSTKGTFAQSATFTINGDTVALGTSYSTLTANINEAVSGINASLNADNTITLSNKTGEAIVIAGSAASDVGFTAGTYTGFVSISNLDGSAVKVEAGSEVNGYTDGQGTIADVQAIGFNETSNGTTLETDTVSGTALSANEIKINDVLVGASTSGQASSIADAINAVAASTGVTANAKNEVQLALNFSAIPGSTTEFFVNNTSVNLTSANGIEGVVTAINNAAIGDIRAKASPDGAVTLSSQSGVDISVTHQGDTDFIRAFKDVNGTVSTSGIIGGSTEDVDSLRASAAITNTNLTVLSPSNFNSQVAFASAGAVTDTDEVSDGQVASTTAMTLTSTATSATAKGRMITILELGNGGATGINFTVTGTDMDGNVQSEVITGGAQSASVSGTKTFNTVTEITADVTSTLTFDIGSITGQADQNYTVTGTDVFGNTMTEVVRGAGGTLQALSNNVFESVTSISSSQSDTVASTIGNANAAGAADDDGLVAAADLAAATALSMVSGSTSLALGGALITITEGGNAVATNGTITVHGTDLLGNDMTEVIVGPAQSATVTGTKAFASVSRIDLDVDFTSTSVKIGYTASIGDNFTSRGKLELSNETGTPIKVETQAADSNTNMKTGSDGTFGTTETILQKMGIQGQSAEFEVSGTKVSVETLAGANASLALIDSAIQTISKFRSSFGAVENRIDASISNLTTLKVNTEAAQSRIQDADFAQETSNLTKAQILSQAATSMLAQANASKQNLLALLQG
jgi:flagellin